MAKRNQPSSYKHHRLEWPNNLLDAIFGEGFHETNTITEDQLAAIDYVIMTGLDTRQQEVIHSRYKQGMSLVEIAAIYNLSRERIRQIETKAIHILKNPVRTHIIKLGLNAFYEQDIKKLYYVRQNLLTTNLRDINIAAGNTVTEKALTAIINDGFQTVGDLCLFTLNDKSRLKLPQHAYTDIVRHYKSIIHEQNMVISALEYHTGNHTKPIISYPTNLFDALYGKTDKEHTGAIPNPKQINGLTYLMTTMLTQTQQSVLYYIYEKGLSVHGCVAKMNMSAEKIADLHRESLRILRTQPSCYTYIDGIMATIMPDFSKIKSGDIQSVEMHDTVKTALAENGITNINELLALTNDEIRAFSHIGEQLLSEIDTQFPMRKFYSQTCEYFTTLGIAPAEQKAIMTSFVHPYNCSAYEILTAIDIPTEQKRHIKKIICLSATSVKTSDLSVRAKNALRNADIHTFKDLYNMSDDELMSIKNLGELTLQNIKDVLGTVLRKIA